MSGHTLNLRRAVPAIVLIVLFAAPVFFTFDPPKKSSSSEFYVGVEFAYSNNINDSQVNLNSLKALVDKVKDYTNLFVIGIPEVSKNEAVLNASCDYIYNAGLHFIVLFADNTKYNYTTLDWTTMAQQKYKDKFLGVYRLDEPSGTELDKNKDRMLNASDFSTEDRNFSAAANTYVDILGAHVNYFHQVLSPTIVTADYGLYWFDYKSGYQTVFAEFGWNQSRQIAVSLCRGAADVQNRDWGAIITWTYTKSPYIESPSQLYNDMELAYDEGAKYVIVFDYPNSTDYGTLTERHFEAIQNFWTYKNSNPQKVGSGQATAAYVLPEGYGFGFRSANDTIWGIWNADDLSIKIWNDTNRLVNQYGPRLDIVYGEPEYLNQITANYGSLYYWNQIIN